MARNILPIIGQAIGSYFGPWGAAIGGAIGSVIGNAVDPLVIDGPRIGEVAQQTSSEGVYQPIYFGTSQGAGNIIAQGPNVIRRRRESQGKGGGPVTVIETLYKTFAIRIGVSWLGEAGIVGISRIWENGKLVYDTRPESTIPEESADFATHFRLYRGTDDQAPDPALEAVYGIGNTPSYRGRAYIVFPLYDITQWRAIPQYSFEVVTGGTSSPPIQIISIRQTESVVSSDWLAAPDGMTFSGPWIESEVLYRRSRYIITTNDRYIAYDGNVNPAYLLKGTAEWVIAEGDPTSGVGGNKVGAASSDGQYIVIPGGLGGPLLVSSDRGNSFHQVISVSINAVTSYSVRFYGFGLDSIYSSVNPDAGWSIIQNTSGFFVGSHGLCSHYSPSISFFGGSSWDVIPVPALAYTDDGISFNYHDFHFFDSDAIVITSISSKTDDDGLSTYVVTANNGQIAYRIGDFGIWTLVEDFRMDVRPWSSTSSAAGFAIIGNDEEIDRIGQIATSPDGINWQIAREDSIDGNEFWFVIGALAVTAGEIVSEPPMLDQVVSSIHTLCYQPANEYDVTSLSDITVRGYILAGGYSGKEAINTLQNLWTVDSPEYDKKIHYRKRGADVVASYTFDDLIDEPEEATREQAIEYPKKLHLDYQSPDVDYAPAKATSSRSSIDARVIGEVGIQVPVVLTPTEAFQRANVLHKISWTDSDGEVVFSIPDENLSLVPGDCISLFLRDSIRRLRIDLIDYYPGKLKLTCRGDRQSAYTSNVEGLTPPAPTPPPPSLVGPTLIVVGDWPALRDQDDENTPVKYVAMGGISPAWGGALGEQSVDGGTTYTEMLSVYQGAIMGTLQNDLPDASPYFADHTNTIEVQLDIQDGSIELDSLTESQFLMEMGGFALQKADGDFEILQYRDVVDLGDGMYELSHFQRGRLDSNTHSFSPGDRFVLLDSVAVVQVPVSHIGVDIYHRATSFGQTTEDGTVVNDIYEGNSQREWPVANILLERSGTNVSGTIVPRHRFGTEIKPIRSINWNHYQITFEDSLGFTEVVTQLSDSISYDASARTFPITVTVRQVNRLTGAGPAKSETIE